MTEQPGQQTAQKLHKPDTCWKSWKGSHRLSCCPLDMQSRGQSTAQRTSAMQTPRHRHCTPWHGTQHNALFHSFIHSFIKANVKTHSLLLQI